MFHGARASAVLALLAAAAGPPDEIHFDKKERENPSSPGPGRLAATGTFRVVEPGHKFDRVEMHYRKVGERVWLTEKKNVQTGEKDGARTWSVQLRDLPAGEYEVKVVLWITGPDGRGGYRETEPARKVQVWTQERYLFAR